ncbi:MAG: 4-hydroxy-3-methylbut-2-enyl diphosphate reductase [Candidatus Saganbacteria bacterium]|nr:4-hydroxy-3-methylbut-2-enyl diphosphate reductase [Candidatus Saganbacteria bacterium]
MQIFIAKDSGFCEGVSAAFGQAKKYHDIFMLGNLVHNRQVVEKLGEQGIKVIKDIKDIKDGETLLISAHGVAPYIYEEAKKKHLKIIDTTCSWVKRAQKLAKEVIEKGYQLIIIGDKNHPEVKGIKGWSNDKGIVISSEKEGEDIYSRLRNKVGVVAQTTQSDENFNSIVSFLQSKVKDLIVHKTICGATQKRQKAAIDLARKVDVMLIIGDRMSANTKRLTELCAKTGTPAHQIQTKAELKPQFLSGKDKIGITAGASTPDWVIEEVVKILKN